MSSDCRMAWPPEPTQPLMLSGRCVLGQGRHTPRFPCLCNLVPCRVFVLRGASSPLCGGYGGRSRRCTRGAVVCLRHAAFSQLPRQHTVPENGVTPHSRSIESWKTVVLDIIPNDNDGATNDGNPEAPPKADAA